MNRVTIAGGGLAGLSLGIALRKNGVAVVLHEAGNYPRHRVCGEFISGVAKDTLRSLGVEEDFEDANRLQSMRWFLHGKSVMESELPEPALGISRYRLDRRLAERFERAGGELKTGSRLKREGEKGLVWAAGRPVESESDWLGLKLHARGLARGADLEMHVGEGGYVGLAPVEAGWVNVCGLFRRREVKAKGVDLLPAYLDAIGLSELAARIRKGDRRKGSDVGVTAFRLGRQKHESGRCVLGDAESMIPPFTGNGMSMAFEAAETAVEPLRSWAAGGVDWDEACAAIRSRLTERFRRRLFTARVLHPFLLSAAGRQLLAFTARTGVLPFGPIFRCLR